MNEHTAQWATRPPHPALRHLVRRYIGYAQHDVTLCHHRGLPSRSITLIISLVDPIRLVDGPGTEHGLRARQAVVGGLHLRPAIIEQDRIQCGLHLELNPLGVRALLGVSAAELAGTTVELAELPTAWARHLTERLADTADWPARFALLDQELRAALRPVSLVAELQRAWQTMVTSRGRSPVAGLADEVGWSRRHLTDRFTRETGVSPKQAARLMRFEYSGALIRAGKHRTLAEIAADAGYYDQAHLTNEWRSLAGCTPRTWITEELPFLQDDPAFGGPDSAHDHDTEQPGRVALPDLRQP